MIVVVVVVIVSSGSLFAAAMFKDKRIVELRTYYFRDIPLDVV